MHDLDRRMFEAEGLGGELEYAEQQEETEFLELLGELLSAEMGQESFETSVGAGEFDDRSAREVALASELLEVQTEEELAQFLSGLFRRAVGGGRRFLRSPTGRALGGILKQAATQTLPPVADAVGDAAAPQPGDPDGSTGKPPTELGLELEGLSQEDREFEVARAFVRFADAATRIAAQAPPSKPPIGIAKAAATTAARRYLPGLLTMPAAGSGTRQHSGRWLRQGNNIVLDEA